jgi:ubiquinone/menaquinone biosynthesis C-methylase UbiE
MAGVRGRAATYDRPLVASLYDIDLRLMSRALWGMSLAEQVRLLAETMSSADGGLVLELPVGTGLVLERAKGDDSAFVIAVDLSAAMLRRARGRLGACAAYVEADAAHLPFRDGAFAACHSGNGFHVFPDRQSAATELARVTRRGGRAAVTSWTDRGNRVARAYHRLLARLGQVNEPLPPDDHCRTFEAAGFVTTATTTRGTVLRWTGHRS